MIPEQIDLLSYRDGGPGFKVPGTSQEAAESIQHRAGYLRAEVYRLLRQSPEPLTADRVAMMMGETVLSIRPRFSELRTAGRIVDSGQRGKNDSGRSAVKWRAA